jgi:hypothetical protein
MVGTHNEYRGGGYWPIGPVATGVVATGLRPEATEKCDCWFNTIDTWLKEFHIIKVLT